MSKAPAHLPRQASGTSSLSTATIANGKSAQGRLARWEGLFLLGVLSLCTILRVAHLAALPIFLDESLYTRAAQIVGAQPGAATLLAMTSPMYGGNPPLFSWLVAPIMRLVPDPLLAARLVSALAGVLGCAATWASGRALWGPATGLLAGVLYACCPFLLFYNRMAMLDGVLAALAAGAFYYAIRLAQRGRPSDALALGLCLGAGMLTKILGATLLLLPLLAVLVAESPRRRAVRRGAVAASFIGIAPLLCVLCALYHNNLYSFALHGHLQTGGGLPHMLGVVWGQAARWAAGSWLYLTPPVLLCAVLGLWTARRERMVYLPACWALLGSLPVVLAPNRFFVPRHFLYIAVPVSVLAAHGLLSLATALCARLQEGVAEGFILCALGLVAAPSVVADAAMIGAPTQTPLIPADRFQYVTGWPSGYMLQPVVAYLRRQAVRGPIVVVAEDGNPPLDMLRIVLYKDTRIAVTAADLGDTERVAPLLLRAARGHRVYVIAHHSSDRPVAHGGASLPAGLATLAARGVAGLALRVTSHDGASDYVVFAVHASWAGSGSITGPP